MLVAASEIGREFIELHLPCWTVQCTKCPLLYTYSWYPVSQTSLVTLVGCRGIVKLGIVAERRIYYYS